MSRHFTWWCAIVYKEGCPGCKVRQLRYGFRIDLDGFNRAIDKVMRSKIFNANERQWILNQIKGIGAKNG